ncbi:MAG: trypsin-like peptidase domain-containing protein, partial [Clostridia bacterium]|nr:trypsin-like peptidase domain-containing protein [Clostridia bacterium]
MSIVHDHTYAEWETVTEPTCTSFGLQKRVCACGYVDYGTTSALEHTPVIDEAVDATCVTTGKTEGSHCGTCGAILTAQTETERVSHDLLEWETVTEPTCTSFGLKVRACACGQAEYATVDALGHTVVTDEAVAATCVTAGKTEGSHCSACGVVISAQCEVAPVGHSLEMSVVEEALCNLDGTKRYSCKNEGCSYYYDESYSLLALTSEEIYTAASRYVGVFATYDRLGYFIRNISGFVIREDGVVVTSAPAFDNTHSAIFMIANENNELETYEVIGVLAYSEATGLAVVKVDATDLPCAPICTSEPTAAETVYTVGAPDGLFPSISEGIISNPAAWVQGQVLIQHDADMSRG